MELLNLGLVLFDKRRGFDVRLGILVHHCGGVFFDMEKCTLILQVIVVFGILRIFIFLQILVFLGIPLSPFPFYGLVDFALQYLIIKLRVVNLFIGVFCFLADDVDTFLQFLEEFLGVGSTMGGISSSYVLFHHIPVLAIYSEGLQE